MTEMELVELEAKLRSLMTGEFSSLTISFNDASAPNYQSVAGFIENFGEADYFDWVSPEEREKALRENSHWSIQWYPATPVGFCRLDASSLTALIRSLSPTKD